MSSYIKSKKDGTSHYEFRVLTSNKALNNNQRNIVFEVLDLRSKESRQNRI